MIKIFVIAAAVIGLLPGASFVLIPLELILVYKILDNYKKFDIFKYLGFAAALVTVSTFLKGFSSLLHFMPIVGQFANSIVAASFMYLVGVLLTKHCEA